MYSQIDQLCLSPQVFKEAGLNSPVLGSIIMGCVNLAGTLAAVALMDRAGRRLLILLSHAGMAACLILIAIVAFIPGQLPTYCGFLSRLLDDQAKSHVSRICNSSSWVKADSVLV